MKPIYKFNNGNGANICNECRTIISTGPKTEEVLCNNCKQKRHVVDIIEKDESLKLYTEIMEKEVHQNRGNLNK